MTPRRVSIIYSLDRCIILSMQPEGFAGADHGVNPKDDNARRHTFRQQCDDLRGRISRKQYIAAHTWPSFMFPRHGGCAQHRVGNMAVVALPWSLLTYFLRWIFPYYSQVSKFAPYLRVIFAVRRSRNPGKRTTCMHVRPRKGPAGLARVTRIRVRMKQLSHRPTQHVESSRFSRYPEVRDIQCQREWKVAKNIGRG